MRKGFAQLLLLIPLLLIIIISGLAYYFFQINNKPQTIANVAPSSTKTLSSPSVPLLSSSVPDKINFGVKILGFRNNKISIYNPDTNEFNESKSTIETGNKKYISSDRTKLLVEKGDLSPTTGQLNNPEYFIYTVTGDLMIDTKINLDDGFSYGNQSGRDFIWDRDSAGFVYVLHKQGRDLCNGQLGLDCNATIYQIRHVSLKDKSDTKIYQYEDNLSLLDFPIAYSSVKNYLIYATWPEPGVSLFVHKLNLATGNDKDLIHINYYCCSLPILSQDQNNLIGIEDNFNGVLRLKSLNLDTETITELPIKPDGGYKTGLAFFTGNTAVFEKDIPTSQNKMGTEIDKLSFIDLTKLSILKEIGAQEIFGSRSDINNWNILDLNSDGVILHGIQQTPNDKFFISKMGVTKELPKDFQPSILLK